MGRAVRKPGRLGRLLPRLSLSALLISLLSGLVLVFQYQPFGEVFADLETMTSRAPFGFFFRRLHYFSGQVFAVLALAHTADHFWSRSYRFFGLTGWLKLWLAACLALLLLFTGFVLKGDRDGWLAGTIFKHILEQVPLLGERLGAVFVGRGKSFFYYPYLWHCWLLPLVSIWLLKDHIRTWLPRESFFGPVLALLCVMALSLELPEALPPETVLQEAHGPWFFLGLQELLKYWPAWLAGLCLPLALSAAFLLLPLTAGRWEITLRRLLLVAVAGYGTFTLLLWMKIFYG